MGTEKCQKRVLVVEDNELNRKIAAQVIEDEGILTECAIDGLEAVKKVREAPEHYFDLILMDVQMPGLNGYQAAEQIRGLGRCDTSCTDSCHDGIHISGRLEAGRTVGNERIYCEAAGYGRFI